jgi:ribosomal protein S18 acetylase RimI-like enzyme
MGAVEAVSLQIREVATASEAEAVRRLRNECRATMTRSTAEILPGQQLAWWEGLDRRANLLYLASAVGPEWHEAAGYGLCRIIDGKWWLSGGLATRWRGRGWGKQLFGHMATSVGRPCWLEVLLSNAPAVATYLGLGFAETSRDDRIATMVLR